MKFSLNEEGPTCLKAFGVLSVVQAVHLYGEAKNIRKPIYVYDRSIRRITQKTLRLCRLIEDHFKKTDNSKDEPQVENPELVDAIELALYAAAEHVDDIESIGLGFFLSAKAAKNSALYKKFLADIKNCKKFIASTANHIKHEQLRIELGAIKYLIEDEPMWLYGCRFVGENPQGASASSQAIHEGRYMFPLPTIVWEIIIFLTLSSNYLAEFVVLQTKLNEPTPSPNKEFCELVKQSVRLPFFEFYEDSALQQQGAIFDDINSEQLNDDSALRGSFPKGWGIPPNGYRAQGILALHRSYTGLGQTETEIPVAFPIVRLATFGHAGGRPPIDKLNNAALL